MGQRMFESYSQVPTVMQSMKVDMTELILFRKKINEGRKEKVSQNDFIIKATAIAVKELPHVRTMIVGDELVTYAEANIGLLAVDGGLFVPVIKNADVLSVREISRQAKNLAAAARRKIRPDDCTGATFTISNMGMFDVFTFNPIINQPESGILGITGIEDVLKMRDGNVVVRQEAVLCMSYDHRVMDGVGSAQLKKRVKELIEHPLDILI
ncbi:MAG: 2-oxo acid dehydrogenase subunit E2 [Frisingicoccus sp.]